MNSKELIIEEGYRIWKLQIALTVGLYLLIMVNGLSQMVGINMIDYSTIAAIVILVIVFIVGASVAVDKFTSVIMKFGIKHEWW